MKESSRHTHMYDHLITDNYDTAMQGEQDGHFNKRSSLTELSLENTYINFYHSTQKHTRLLAYLHKKVKL